MKRLAFFTALALVLTGTAANAQTNEPDPYADAVFTATNQVFMPGNAVGAPDTAYADFFSSTAMQHFTLDMGEGEEGIGDLTFHYRRFDIQAQYRVKLLDEQMVVLAEKGGFFPGLESNSGAITVSYDGATPYRYVRFDSFEEETWSVDAVMAEDYVSSDDTPTPEEEEEEELTPEELPEQGTLVKLPDDGDPTTTFDATVYVVGEDGTRHAFPTSTVFFSWFENFDLVQTIDKATMSAMSLGKNVTIRPGTHLIKLTTDPKTYAVEPGGVLRHVTTEGIARALWGDDWADRVVDMPDVFFGNYMLGDPMNTTIHPEGTTAISPNGGYMYVRNGTYLTVPDTLYATMRFQIDHNALMQTDIFNLYLHAGNLGDDPNLKWPY